MNKAIMTEVLVRAFTSMLAIILVLYFGLGAAAIIGLTSGTVYGIVTLVLVALVIGFVIWATVFDTKREIENIKWLYEDEE